MRTLVGTLAGLMIAFAIVPTVQAGPIDPNCTVGKAAKGAAQRATVGYRDSRTTRYRSYFPGVPLIHPSSFCLHFVSAGPGCGEGR